MCIQLPRLPSFFLLTEPSSFDAQRRHSRPSWRFELREENGSRRLTAVDQEPGWSIERLALLSVVRGLEALEEPCEVTLLNPHRYVSRALHFGLEEWREMNWRWERFGQLVEIRNADLWRRVDHAMAFHRLECRIVRIDSAHHCPRKPMRRGKPTRQANVRGQLV